MGLSNYHAKRDFKRTPEPRGDVADKKARARTYLIQKHAASHLHYDFRLELNGVLVSWAVPKGPSLDPKPANSARPVGAKRCSQPARLAAALATLVKVPPEGVNWIHEVKYDGYRMLSRLANGKVSIYSRSGADWTSRIDSIAAEVKDLDATTAWLDGELCAIDGNGVSDFQSLQNALSELRSAKLVYFVFDLLYLDGYDLRHVVLSERKRLLKELLERSNTAIRYSPEVRGSGAEVFKQSCARGLEGIVSKRLDAVYHSGQRTRHWVKVKCLHRQEMVIGGFTDPQGSRQAFGALMLGVYDKGELRYAGKVGTGFDDRTLTALYQKLLPLEQQRPPFINPPRGFEAKGAHWIKPALVAESQFTEWSEGGALRQPVFIGLREDKVASTVVREKSGALEGAKKGSLSAPKQKTLIGVMRSGKDSSEALVAGVKISHPDKLLFPEAMLTKQSLAQYYSVVAAWIMPYIEQRPLSLFRCPDGWSKQCFYQKHADPNVHASVKRVQVPDGEGTATYFAANSLQALVGLVQWGVIELHPWGSRMPHPERPDRLIFDLDPADDVSWTTLVQAVRDLRTLLKQLGLQGFLKTTGGKGLHIVVPIQQTLTWAQAKSFAKAIADLFARTFPHRFVSTASKAQRKGRIFIDYLRNAEGATAIAPYGIRAQKNAPVATPVSWQELKKDIRFDFFNVKTVPSRLQKLQVDPWQDFTATRQTITAAMFKDVGAKR